MNTQIITGPLIGGVIGLITNGLAIKMLFRPINPVYLDKKNKRFRVPFTPGLIPKEKPRIASAIGRVIGNKILDDETLKKALLSEDIHNKLNEKITDFVEKYAHMDCSIGEFLEQKEYLNKVDDKEVIVKEKLSNHVSKKLLQVDLGKKIIEIAMQELAKKLSPMIMSMIIKGLNIEHLEEKINGIAQEKVPEYIGTFIDKEYSTLKEKPLGETITKLIELYPNYADKVWEIYQKIVEDKSKDIIKEFNISKIVEDKINEFDLEELERLINEIADKELKALIWLGGILGMLMGIINAII